MNKHLEQLREKMRERGIDVYVVPTSDYHESEYVSEHFACRRYITGFTGSAGTAVVTMEKAGLWTDGRYFVQAAKQLEGSGVTLQKMGVEGVPTILEYLRQAMPEGGTLGFDGRVVNELLGEEMEAAVAARHAKIAYGEDLVGMIWADRPALSREPVWILDEKYCGKSAAEKIADLRAAMREAGADVHVLTALDDIVWLLNIRGNDVPCNPVVLSYLAVTETEVLLFIQEEALDDSARSYLESLGVAVKPYDSIYDYVKTLAGQAVMVEKSRVNYALCHNLDASCRVIDRMNPTALAKAVKNPVEMENIRRAHIKDGVAVTKYIYWLKKNIGKIPMDEMSVADRLEEFRREQQGYLGPSFNTISAYGPNAAMCHYSATEESKAVLEPRGLYLVDSGGQYYEGTTDITRTIALGELTAEEREHFTLTAMSMLRLGNVKFLHGCRGLNLDYVAREVFWQRGLNFDHGTGHGVGYLLNVHERPNGIRWKVVPERQDSGVLEEGMLTSDEPGIYIEGSHGIRTENLILCRKAEKTEYGQFMRFEFVTFVPIDLDAIDKSLMRPEDVEMLNAYHREVYEKISPYLTAEEADWLREATREI